MRPDIDGPLYVDCDGQCDAEECHGRHPIRCACGRRAVDMVDIGDGDTMGVCRKCKDDLDTAEGAVA